MRKTLLLSTGLVTSLMMAGLVGAATPDKAAPPVAESSKQSDKEFGKVSADGTSAFEDIHLARLAIFDGKTEEASKLVTDAQASLAKAKTDDTAFVKAESALKAPSQTTPSTLANRQKGVTPIAWIPIASEIIVGDTFQATPDKAAAVVTARKHLAKGESAKALETIKLASIDVDYTLAVAPLDDTIAAVDAASKFIASKDYYDASQSLRTAEAGVRYDEVDDVANVSGKGKAAGAKAK